jgi:uncharacterized protein (DUF2126 family)
MFTSKKYYFTLPVSTVNNYSEAATLVTELNDATAEKVCGGAITTPETTGGNNINTMPTTGNKTNIPSPTGYENFGLTPFLPDLPAAKLPRLGPLDPSKRTATTPKDSITITIPLPLPVH